MKVWWCNVHDAEQSVPGVMCWKKEVRMIGALRRHCRFVEMQLVPADALVIEKRNGKWPTWLTEVISEWRLTVDMFMVDFEDAYTDALNEVQS